VNFDLDTPGLEDDDRESLKGCNEALAGLRQRKVKAVLREGDAGRSKGVWLIRGLQQILLYRVVMLTEGCAMAWNGRNPLAALLCARAMFETAAVLWDLQSQFAKMIERKHFSAIYNLARLHAHGTRLEEWITEHTGTKAFNALTLIDKMDAELKVAREIYDHLSEFCHPNYCGHHLIFSSLDTTNATLTLGDDIWETRNLLSTLIAALTFVNFVDDWLTRIDEQMPAILALSEAARHA
jgi:hypothetical protein